jgi:hypothetical protein
MKNFAQEALRGDGRHQIGDMAIEEREYYETGKPYSSFGVH